MKRSELRETAVKLLYEMDINKDFSSEYYNKFLNDNNLDLGLDNYLKNIYIKFIENKDLIDDKIQFASTSWDIKRIAKVDLSILRVSIVEILYCEDIPNIVSINEAIDIAKKYGDENSYKFINGLLGKILNDKIN